MLQVNKMIHDVHEALGITGIGEQTPGEYTSIGLRELNQLISTLNSQGYLSLAQAFHQVGPGGLFIYKKLVAGEQKPDNVIDMVPPEHIEAVTRTVGTRQLPLNSIDTIQLASHNPRSIATSWNYSRTFEPIPDDPDGHQREVGVVQLDGFIPHGGRIYFSAKLPTYDLDDTIYLSDLYDELLISGLKFRLADFHDLDDKKEKAETEFRAAKRIIKRNNITQRMLQTAPVMGSYEDSYFDGMAGVGWG